MAKLRGKTPAKFFGTFAYVHEKNRVAGSRLTSFRSTTGFQEGLLREEVSRDIELMLNRPRPHRRLRLRYDGLESRATS